MKKIIFMTLLAGVMLSLLSSSTYGWGSITHAFIADKGLGKKFGYANSQEMYGSTLPDMVNLKNIPPTNPYDILYAKLHLLDPMYQEAILREAKWCYQKAAAFGLISHRDVPGGADYTAHQDAAYNPDPDPGYVEAKRDQLIADLEEELLYILVDGGVPVDPAGIIVAALAPTVADFGVETGVDFLIKREDPLIGLRLFFAASFRSIGIPYMLARAYSDGDWGLAQIIIGSEREFREMMKLYGQAFLLNENAAIESITTQWVPIIYEIAENLDIDISGIDEGRLIALGIEVIQNGIVLCQDDYYDEIMATIEYVRKALEAEGIDTCPSW